MESRNIALTIKKAREWYNSGSSDLKEVALQAFTQEELTTPKYTDIKTFEDAVKDLGMDLDNVLYVISSIEAAEGKLDKHLTAIYKLDIIRKALNGDWKPQMNEGTIYYPYVRYYPYGNKAEEVARINGWTVKETFVADGKKYQLVGGGSYCYGYSGLGHFVCGFGVVSPDLSLLCCKSGEIAEHMSKYFAKEIFEATYAQHTSTYRFI